MAITFVDVEQGSGDWFKLRLGKPTASMAHKIVTPGGKLSEQRDKYLYKLVAERLLLESMDDDFQSEWMRRGKENEPYAAQQFEFLENCELEQVGFVMDDNELMGCSPDRLIKGRAEAVEIKCPSPPVQIGRLLDGLGTDYKPQVQMQLLVGEFDRVHFYSWHPQMPPFHLITLPDRAYQKILAKALADFLVELDRETARARDMGAYSPQPYATPFDRAAPAPEPKVNIIPE
jgi:hypothetical protein